MGGLTEPEALLLAVLNSADSSIEILPLSEERAAVCAESFGMDCSTLMGAAALTTGGIVADKWVRIYGSGELDFAQKNEELTSFGKLLIGEDITGGLFGVERSGGISYFAPDTLRWEELGMSMESLIGFIASEEKLSVFYKALGFEHRQRLTERLTLSQGLMFAPPIWAERNVKRSVRLVDMTKLFALEKELSEQFFAGRVMPDGLY